MGELPDELLEICQRLAKLTEMLRGLAELFLNDLQVENQQDQRYCASASVDFTDEPRAGDV